MQGDGGECLRGLLHLDVLFGLDCLVQAVAPLAAFHDAARLLVDYFHLAVHHYVLVVLVEHGVGLEQLLQGMHAFALHGVVVEQAVLLVKALLVVKILFVLEGRQLRRYVGEDEQILVVHLPGEPVCTFVCEVDRVQFFVNHEIQRLHGLWHLAVVVLHVVLFRLEHAGLDAFL